MLSDDEVKQLAEHALEDVVGSPITASPDEETLASLSREVRDALVPLQTIAGMLQQRHDPAFRDWCSWMLLHTVQRIVRALERV